MKGTERFKQTIKAYLDERAKTDTLFNERYQNTTRTIDDVVTYILNQVKASGCAGFDDMEIFSMAVHVIDEPTLDIGKPISCDVVINHQVQLTDEEKAQARNEAIKAFQAEEIRKIRERQMKPKPAPKKENQSLSLFDFAE